MKKIITVFGSTGNLMYKKLFPALSSLIKKGHIKNDAKIYCVARIDCTLEDYIEVAKQKVTEYVDWDLIIPFLTYIKMDINNVEDYIKLKQTLDSNGEIDSMFYLAVPPVLFPIIAKGISESKLIEKQNPQGRIIFEKPFGENLKSAQNINENLWKYFDESQIYRIDHYLGKEMIQNILVVRFANSIFEKTWNKDSIESVSIIAKESEGVMQRGNYYDKIGALKDMVQSHLLQMASLIAMETPTIHNSEAIKDQKIKVMQHFTINPKDVVLGQYASYKDELNISQDSKTDTFVYFKAFINNDRWKGVPFYFITGKKLDEKRSEIIIKFKDSSTSTLLWPNQPNMSNKLIIKVAPKEGVNFKFNVKEPGLNNKIVPADLDYCHSCQVLGNTPEAYEKLLLDLINKNSTLFTRWDEIETFWGIVDSLKEKLDDPFIYNNFSDLKPFLLNNYMEVNNDL
ncbi:glucose-6-phosphate dehydrogenase [Mycoplasmatota bacterium WC30]